MKFFFSVSFNVITRGVVNHALVQPTNCIYLQCNSVISHKPAYDDSVFVTSEVNVESKNRHRNAI